MKILEFLDRIGDIIFSMILWIYRKCKKVETFSSEKFSDFFEWWEEREKFKEEEPTESELTRIAKERVDAFLGGFENAYYGGKKIPKEIMARVFVGAMGYLLYQVKRAHEIKGDKKGFELILNYGKNFREIYEAKKQGISESEIVEKYLLPKEKQDTTLMYR